MTDGQVGEPSNGLKVCVLHSKRMMEKPFTQHRYNWCRYQKVIAHKYFLNVLNQHVFVSNSVLLSFGNRFIHSDEQFPHTQTHGKTRRIMQLQHPAPINMTATSHIRVSASDQGNKGRAGPRMRGPNYPWVRSTEHNAAGEKLDGASVRGWQRHNDPLWHRLGIAACLRWKMLRAQDKTVHRLMNSVHV